MVDMIVYSVITIHLPPLPYLRVVDSGHWKRNLSTYRNAILSYLLPLTFLKTETWGREVAA